jgi:hypothetical protein
MRFRLSYSARLALLSLAAGALALPAQENTVWHIGDFDHTAAEFGGRVGNQPVVVDADAPDAARRWPASQAGTLNAASGPQSHSRTVQFRLIGIGAAVTRRPLPHHRAYGSVHGGSSRLR